MNIDQLKYIVEVGKTNSIGLAAETLYLTQPALSQSISSLEKELGIQLFSRSRQGAAPTMEGQILIEKASEVIQKLEEFQNRVQMFKTDTQKSIKISSVPSMMDFALNALLSYKELHPNVQVEIFERNGSEVMLDIQKGTVDFGLILAKNMEGYADKISFESLLDGKIQVLVSQQSFLSCYDHVTIQDIQYQPIVLYNGPVTMRLFNSLFPQPARMLFISNDIQIIMKAVAANMGISFTLDFFTKHDQHVLNGSIIPIDLIIHPPVPIKAGWAASKQKKLSHSAIQFLHFIRKDISIRHNLNAVTVR
ncbi:hypothetical protein AF332_26180 [Sporosarcina globispora]|uniref:HTH lysR-type domain-containing protein n=1 Tax=Sporosarcina globispora TaxID=1459 RepID=A0A0M0GKH2_SPOGL|nr:LysR family transcriptional regulator [Sporosarcina globispora]KON89967.1 hypothetical protein AF332_26180 [Sporosarcina globispora]